MNAITTRRAGMPEPPATVDAIVTRDRLQSPPIITLAHVVTDERVTVPLAGAALLALALAGISAVWFLGYGQAVIAAAIIVAAAVAAGRE